MPVKHRPAAPPVAVTLLVLVLALSPAAGAVEGISDEDVDVPAHRGENITEHLSSPMEQELLSLVNEAREEGGLQPLALSCELLRVARGHADEMIEMEYFSHRSPVTGSPRDRVRQAGLSPLRVGENLAGNTSVVAAHLMLMGSPAHRANILGPYEVAGLAVVRGGPYGMMIVQMFASGLGESTPPDDLQ